MNEIPVWIFVFQLTGVHSIYTKKNYLLKRREKKEKWTGTQLHKSFINEVESNG